MASQRVVLADDHEVVRYGLRLLIEEQFGFQVLEASNAVDAVAWAKDPTIDLVMLDVRLGERDGIWALREIRKIRPTVPVLMLSTFSDPDYVEAAIEGAANGYLLKESNTSQFREAIETALSGRGLYLHPSVAQSITRKRRTDEKGGHGLSEREFQVLELLAHGTTNEDIGKALFLSEKTVKSHLSNIFRKLEVTNRTQAASKAIRDGLVKNE